MTNFTTLNEQYGDHFEGLYKEDRAAVAGIILLFLSLGSDQPNRFLTLLTLSSKTSRHLVELSDEAGECLQEIHEAQLDHPRLLDICSALLAGCR